MKTNHFNRRRWLLQGLVVLTLAMIAGVGVTAARPLAVDWPEIELTEVAGDFSNPIQVTHAGDGSGRLFVVEKGGVIKIIQNGAVVATPFLDIHERVNSTCNECGLLGVAFPPDFASKGYFFVYYNAYDNPVDLPSSDPEPDPTAGNDSVIARFKLSADPNLANAASEEQILLVNQPYRNHNGGQLAFGKDNHLYIGLGDGGDGGDPLNSGQRLDTLLGKILRISVGESGDYSIPADNPFVDSTVAGVKKEIWNYGLRNPWRFSFDRTTGDLYIGDVGQGSREEIDYEPFGQGGRNYGWNIIEGTRCYPDGLSCNTTGLTPPIFDYERSLGSSVTGGVIYRGTSEARMAGVYFFGDYISGRLWGAKQESGIWEVKELLNTGKNISSFGEDEAGNAYLVDYSGKIYQLSDKGPEPTIPPESLKEKVYLPLISR